MACDRALIERTLRGEREAFEELIESYVGLVHGVIYNKVRRADEVEDLVQEVFLKAYQQLPSLRERDRFASWLGRIATNHAQAWLRRRQAQRTTVTDDPRLLERVDTDSPDELLESRERDGILWDALDRLRPEYRQILLLYHFENCPQQEIARFLGIALPTVKWRLMRARGALRRRVDQVVRGGPTTASRQRQRERIAAALPLLAPAASTSRWSPPPFLWGLLRRGLAVGGAATLGLGGSLAYETRVSAAEAQASRPATRTLSVRLVGEVGRVGADAVPEDGQPEGTRLLPPCAAGQVRRP